MYDADKKHLQTVCPDASQSFKQRLLEHNCKKQTSYQKRDLNTDQ